MNAEAPHQIIQRYVTGRAALSDELILSELEALAPLCDENDPAWDSDDYWRDEAYRYLAFADLVAIRKLKVGVRLLLERACFGDPGEIMRGLRHSCEAVFNPDWDALTAVCLPLAASPRAGTRLWAIDQLIVLDDPVSETVLRRAMTDELKAVRQLAQIGIDRLNRNKI